MSGREGFSVIQLSGKNKFLQKKKKQKERQTNNIQQINNILKIQKNIQRFRDIIRHQPKNIQSEQDLFFITQEYIFEHPNLFEQYFSTKPKFSIIEKKMCLHALRFMIKNKHNSMKDEDLEEKIIRQVLKRFSFHKFFFENLNKVQRQQFINIFVMKSQEPILHHFTEESSIFISKEVKRNLKNFIEHLSKGSLLALTLLFQERDKQEIKIDTSFQEQLSQDILSNAYQNIQKFLKNLREIPYKNSYFFKVMNFLINKLVLICEQSILKAYNVKEEMLEIGGDEIKQVIKEKDEWLSFVDFLDLKNIFYVSVIRVFINIQKVITNKRNQSLELYNFTNLIMELMPQQNEITFSYEEIQKLLDKLVTQIKVHEIQGSIEQQQELLPLFMILEKAFSEISDIEFVNRFQNERKSLQKMIKYNFMRILGKMIFITKETQYSHKISRIGIKILQNLYNKSFRTKLISTQAFINEYLTQKFSSYNFNNTNDEIDMFVRNFPYIFPLVLRLKKFRSLTRGHYNNYYNDDEDWGGYTKVKIRRNHQFEDAYHMLHNKNIRKPFEIKFINDHGLQEIGIDAGGLMKQFINRVLKVIFKEQFGMFIQNHQKQLIPHPIKAQNNDQKTSSYYEFIGKIIGKALMEGITIGPKFSGPFLNALIGKKNTLQDLWKIDSQLYKSLINIKNMKEDASLLELTFEYRDQERKRFINLKPNGCKVQVTNENKVQYINLLANYKVNKLIEYQSRHIKKGLVKVINQEWLFMFNYEQLNYLISGAGQINFEELKKYTKYSGYTYESQTIISFWKVVLYFNEQEKANLLMFVTSCPRPSFLGFADLSPPFTIIKNGNKTDSLPISHTCGNILELPDYKDQQLLRTKLLIAIRSNSGFQLA